jgi:hypothetical protein
VLHFSDNNSSGVLEIKLIRLTRNYPEQVFSDAVVLTKPNGVHH